MKPSNKSQQEKDAYQREIWKKKKLKGLHLLNNLHVEPHSLRSPKIKAEKEQKSFRLACSSSAGQQ